PNRMAGADGDEGVNAVLRQTRLDVRERANRAAECTQVDDVLSDVEVGHDVVAAEARQQVVAAVADQRVGKLRADDSLDGDERVRGTAAVDGRARREIDGDGA